MGAGGKVGEGSGVEGICPACDAPLPEAADHCARCGFPTALGRLIPGPVVVPNEEAPEGGEPSGRPRAPAPEPAGPETEVNSSLARGLVERMELLRTLDRDAPDVTSELCEAALNEASGRVGDAQQILRTAQGRMDQETEELLGRHLEHLESRGRALEATGVRLALEEELARIAETILSGSPAASVAALATAERRMDGLESHWRGLQGLFAQVTTLRDQAAHLGISLADVPDRLAAAREGLASMPVTDADLDAAAQVAADTLMKLHAAIPPALEQELARHAAALDALSGPPRKLAPVRRQHAEAVGHLKEGRLEDAVRSVRELREALEELTRPAPEVPAVPPATPQEVPPAARLSRPLARPPGRGPLAPSTRPLHRVPSRGRGVGPHAPTPAGVPPPELPPSEVPEHEPPSPEPSAPEAPAGPPLEAPPAKAPGGPLPSAARAEAPVAGAAQPPEPAAGAVPSAVGPLMMKVRSLAVQVRALPPDSPEAEVAAREIHEATELLRARRLAEADEALTRLMHTLASSRTRT